MEKERANRAQDAVLEAEARARALADLHSRDIGAQLDQFSEDQVIERQMRDLKAKNKPLRDLPLLHEGKANPSPLIPPKPQKNAPVKKVAEGNQRDAPGWIDPELANSTGPAGKLETNTELNLTEWRKSPD